MFAQLESIAKGNTPTSKYGLRIQQKEEAAEHKSFNILCKTCFPLPLDYRTHATAWHAEPHLRLGTFFKCLLFSVAQ